MGTTTQKSKIREYGNTTNEDETLGPKQLSQNLANKGRVDDF